jgi:hypothetical protein
VFDFIEFNFKEKAGMQPAISLSSRSAGRGFHNNITTSVGGVSG